MRLYQTFAIALYEHLDVYVTVSANCFYEHWGADADGNRGQWMFFAEDEEIECTDPLLDDEDFAKIEKIVFEKITKDWKKLYDEEEK